MQPLDLNSAVADVLPLVVGDARKRRIQLRTELATDLPPVFGNQTQLQQVLINLIVNGMDAMANTPEGKRDLVVRTAKPNGDARIEVSVTDRGSGIPSGSLPRLFESFFTTRAEGMGLGLSIARSIVETHGGRIWADNNPDGGATFHFTVPTASNRAGSAEGRVNFTGSAPVPDGLPACSRERGRGSSPPSARSKRPTSRYPAWRNRPRRRPR